MNNGLEVGKHEIKMGMLHVPQNDPLPPTGKLVANFLFACNKLTILFHNMDCTI